MRIGVAHSDPKVARHELWTTLWGDSRPIQFPVDEFFFQPQFQLSDFAWSLQNDSYSHFFMGVSDKWQVSCVTVGFPSKNPWHKLLPLTAVSVYLRIFPPGNPSVQKALTRFWLLQVCCRFPPIRPSARVRGASSSPLILLPCVETSPSCPLCFSTLTNVHVQVSASKAFSQTVHPSYILPILYLNVKVTHIFLCWHTKEPCLMGKTAHFLQRKRQSWSRFVSSSVEQSRIHRADWGNKIGGGSMVCVKKLCLNMIVGLV